MRAIPGRTFSRRWIGSLSEGSAHLPRSTTDRGCRTTRDSALNWSDLDRRAVDTVRVLAMDAVEKAGNGHPGTAMSLAPAAYLLFNRVMRHDPTDPNWAGRDRFVLSCGHSSLTLYIQLYLSGYGAEPGRPRSRCGSGAR